MIRTTCSSSGAGQLCRRALLKNNLRDGEQSDSFWRKKAGLQAAALAETLANYEVAAKVYSQAWKNCSRRRRVCLKKKIANVQAHLPSGKN